MFIKKIIGITNYRNLSNVEFEFDDEINFIVGENNIGKTNLIKMINKIVSVGKFTENDFNNIKSSIEIIFQIECSKDEIGFFENTFDIDDEHTITITAYQEDVDSRIEYCHTESGSYINPKTIKMLNFVYYSSLRQPNTELDFTRKKGSGKVLNYIMNKSLKSKDLTEIDLINKNEIHKVVDEVNSKFSKLNGLPNENIETYLSDDKENIINRLLEIGDTNGRKLSHLGDGLQYSFNIFLNILGLLVHLKTTKKEEEYKSLLIEGDNGNKYLSLIIGLDEPEIHQHPYRQRALIRSIREIMNNKNDSFIDILKDLFDIDGFIGQVIVVTHSPNILLDDYKQIIRIFDEGNSISATSGSILDFEDDIHKHLKRSFMYFKEAMFSKSVILVEGDTEFGAVPVFAEKMNYDLDAMGVGVIKLDGADGVLKYLELFNAFNINAIAILDKDKEDTYKTNKNIIFTAKEDFEEEIMEMFLFREYLHYLLCINEYGFLISLLRKKIDEFNIKKFCENPIDYRIPKEIEKEIMLEIKDNEIKKMRKLKNAINGSLLAKFAKDVPDSFKEVIITAVSEGDLND